MADIRISHLPDGGQQRGGDLVAATRAGSDFKAALGGPVEPSYRGEYSGSGTYGLGDYVSDTSSPPNFYISRTENNVGNLLTSAANWTRLAPGDFPSVTPGGLANATEVYNANVDVPRRGLPQLLSPALAIPSGKVWYVHVGRGADSSFGEIDAAWAIVATDDIRALPEWSPGQTRSSANSLWILPVQRANVGRAVTPYLLRNDSNQLVYYDDSSNYGANPLRIRQSA